MKESIVRLEESVRRMSDLLQTKEDKIEELQKEKDRLSKIEQAKETRRRFNVTTVNMVFRR